MAVSSAAIKLNVDFVLDNLNIRHYFDVIVCSDNVQNSKPNAETYLNVLPNEFVVFDDVTKGVESAANAGVQTVVITGLHKQQEFEMLVNVSKFISDYNGLLVSDLFL